MIARLNNTGFFKQFPLTPMGVLAPVSAHTGPSAQPPIGTSGNFPALVSAESISPNFPISSQKRSNWGCRGAHPNVFFIGFLTEVSETLKFETETET